MMLRDGRHITGQAIHLPDLKYQRFLLVGIMRTLYCTRKICILKKKTRFPKIPPNIAFKKNRREMRGTLILPSNKYHQSSGEVSPNKSTGINLGLWSGVRARAWAGWFSGCLAASRPRQPRREVRVEQLLAALPQRPRRARQAGVGGESVALPSGLLPFCNFGWVRDPQGSPLNSTETSGSPLNSTNTSGSPLNSTNQKRGILLFPMATGHLR